MDKTSTTDRVADSLVHYLRSACTEHTEGISGEPGGQGAPPEFCIAFSREAGAGAAEIAELLGKRLGWRVYDRDLLERIGKDLGMQAGLLDHVDEKAGHWLREQLHAFFAIPTIGASAYVHRLVELLLALSAQGSCVVVGRGASLVMPRDRTLRIRVVANREDRIAKIRKHMGMSRETATAWVEKTDLDRLGFARDYFHKDANDAHLYDLVLNTSRFTFEECADLIVESLERLRKRNVAKKAQAVAVG